MITASKSDGRPLLSPRFDRRSFAKFPPPVCRSPKFGSPENGFNGATSSMRKLESSHLRRGRASAGPRCRAQRSGAFRIHPTGCARAVRTGYDAAAWPSLVSVSPRELKQAFCSGAEDQVSTRVPCACGAADRPLNPGAGGGGRIILRSAPGDRCRPPRSSTPHPTPPHELALICWVAFHACTPPHLTCLLSFACVAFHACTEYTRCAMFPYGIIAGQTEDCTLQKERSLVLAPLAVLPNFSSPETHAR